MKKLVLLFGAAVLGLTSCTADKTDSAGLVKKMTIEDYPMTFTYDGLKIVKMEGAASYPGSPAYQKHGV